MKWNEQHRVVPGWRQAAVSARLALAAVVWCCSVGGVSGQLFNNSLSAFTVVGTQTAPTAPVSGGTEGPFANIYPSSVFVASGIMDPSGSGNANSLDPVLLADETVNVVYLLYPPNPLILSNSYLDVFAGNGTRSYSGDGGPAVYASLNAPTHVTFWYDSVGGVASAYITDAGNFCIRKVNIILPDPVGTTIIMPGNISTVVGNCTHNASTLVAGTPETSALPPVGPLAVHPVTGNLYFVVTLTPMQDALFWFDATTGGLYQEYGGSDVKTMRGIAFVDVGSSKLLATDSISCVLWEVTGFATATPIAGSGGCGGPPGIVFPPYGTPSALHADLGELGPIAVDASSGTIYFADRTNALTYAFNNTSGLLYSSVGNFNAPPRRSDCGPGENVTSVRIASLGVHPYWGALVGSTAIFNILQYQPGSTPVCGAPPSPSPSPTVSPTVTPSPSYTLTVTPSPSPSRTATSTISRSFTPVASSTTTRTRTPMPSAYTPTVTGSKSPTGSGTITPSSPTATPSDTSTSSSSASASVTSTESASASKTPPPTSPPTASGTASRSASVLPSDTPLASRTPSESTTASDTPPAWSASWSASASESPLATESGGIGTTATDTPMPSASPANASPGVIPPGASAAATLTPTTSTSAAAAAPTSPGGDMAPSTLAPPDIAGISLGGLALLALLTVGLCLAARRRAAAKKAAQDGHSDADSSSIQPEVSGGRGGVEMVAINPLLALPPLSAQQARTLAGAVTGAITRSAGARRLLSERLTRGSALEALRTAYNPAGVGLLPPPVFQSLVVALQERSDVEPAVLAAATTLRRDTEGGARGSRGAAGDVTTAAAPARGVARSTDDTGAVRGRAAALPPGAAAQLLQQAITAAVHIAVLTYFMDEDGEGGDPEAVRAAFTSALRRASQLIAAGGADATPAAIATAVADSFLATTTPEALRRAMAVLGKEELWSAGSDALRPALYRRRATFLDSCDVEAAPPMPRPLVDPGKEFATDTRAAFAPTIRRTPSAKANGNRYRYERGGGGGAKPAVTASARRPSGVLANFTSAVARRLSMVVGPASDTGTTAGGHRPSVVTAAGHRPSVVAVTSGHRPSVLAVVRRPSVAIGAATPGAVHRPSIVGTSPGTSARRPSIVGASHGAAVHRPSIMGTGTSPGAATRRPSIAVSAATSGAIVGTSPGAAARRPSMAVSPAAAARRPTMAISPAAAARRPTIAISPAAAAAAAADTRRPSMAVGLPAAAAAAAAVAARRPSMAVGLPAAAAAAGVVARRPSGVAIPVTGGGAAPTATTAPQPRRILAPPARATTPRTAALDAYAPFARPLLRQGRAAVRTPDAAGAAAPAHPASPGTVARSPSLSRSPAARAGTRGSPLRLTARPASAAPPSPSSRAELPLPPPPSIASRLAAAVSRRLL